MLAFPWRVPRNKGSNGSDGDKGAFSRLFFMCARQTGPNPGALPALGQQRRVFWAPWGGMTRQGDKEDGVD